MMGSWSWSGGSISGSVNERETMTITFLSVVIQTATMALDEGTKRIRIYCRASLTKEVRDKMDWPEPVRENDHRTIEEAARALKLDGELPGAVLTFTTNDKELKKYGFEIHAEGIKDFQLVAVKEGEGRRRELRFQILAVAGGTLGVVEAFSDKVGQAKCSLRVSYAEQAKLEDAE